MILKINELNSLSETIAHTSIDARQFRIVHPASILIGNDDDSNLNNVHNICKPLLSMINLY